MTTDDREDSPGRRPVPRQLILMRHAKSDWTDETLSDHDRPLNKRGRSDASRMGKWLADLDLVPNVILCSSATRTRQTVSRMRETWSADPDVLDLDDLYLAAPETILSRIRSDGLDAPRILAVGHNPGMSHLVSSLADQIVEMPTAAIAVFAVSDPDWSKLSLSTPVDLVHFMRPKAL